MVEPEPEVALPVEHVGIDFAVLGDFAQAVNGKLTVVGAGWNLINAPQYPLTLPFGIGVGVKIPWAETNRKHRFAFAIQGEGGAQIVSGSGEVEAGRQVGTPPGMAQRVVLGIAGQLQLTGPGAYQVIVTAGEDTKTIPFHALPVPGIPSVSG